MDIAVDPHALARQRAPAPSRYDSVFFGGWAILLAVTAFAAFGPSFPLSAQPASELLLSPFIVVHAGLFFAWVVFYPVQVLLIAKRAIRRHRQLGIAGVVLAASMVVTGLVAQFDRTRRVVLDGTYANNLFVERLGLSLGVLDILVFAAFVIAAILLRHQPDQHKRLMLFATVAIIGPAMIKFPAVTALHPLAVILSPLIFVVPLLAYDLLTRRRLMLATVWGVVISVGYHILAMVFAGTGVSDGVARWAAG